MSKKAKIVSAVVYSIWFVVCVIVACSSINGIEFGVKTIMMDVQYNVPWNVIIRQSFMLPFLTELLVGLLSIYHMGVYADCLIDTVWSLLHRSKEEKDLEQFTKWMKKEQKRLRKLERTC